MSKINLQEPQHNRNVTANFVNLIMTSTVQLQFTASSGSTNSIEFMNRLRLVLHVSCDALKLEHTLYV